MKKIKKLKEAVKFTDLSVGDMVTIDIFKVKRFNKAPEYIKLIKNIIKLSKSKGDGDPIIDEIVDRHTVVVRASKSNTFGAGDVNIPIDSIVVRSKEPTQKNEVTTSANIPTDATIGPMNPTGKFRGMPYFDCPDDVFTKCVQGKRKFERWARFTGEDSFSMGIRGWIKSNPRTPFLLRNEKSGTFIFSRRSY